MYDAESPTGTAMRTIVIVLLAVIAIVLGLFIGLVVRSDPNADTGGLTVREAEAALRSPAFTMREDSSIRRELVEVLYVRRIGDTSTEVEFTWRDNPTPQGQAPSIRTSMALFRNRDGQQWVLTSLYKVD